MLHGGLILEGGGMRGVYTAGVLDAFLESDIFFENTYGVSAGVCHACSYLSRQKGRAFRTVTDFSRDRKYASIHSLLTTGDYFGVQMVYKDIPYQLLPFDFDAFTAKQETLYGVVTNCKTGLPVYLKVQDLHREMDIIRASSSLPLLSRMVELDGVPYLDGGISDSIPLQKSITSGNAKNVVILTQHRGFRKKPTGMMTAMKLRYRRWPGLIRSMAMRHVQYNTALDLIHNEERQGRAVVIQPAKPVAIDRLEKDMGKLKELYNQGLEDGRRMVPAVQALFA